MTLLAPARADFPVLPHTGVAYLDSGATSQTPLPVIDAMDAYYREYRASIHRGIYPIAALATEAYETAREKVAAFAGSAPGETVFTRNATEAINLVAYSWGSANVGAGDLIVVTEMEHHSNIVPWQMLCQRTGAELAYVPIDDEGLLVEDELDALLARGPKLVGVAHISNVLGTVNDVASIARRAHAAGALVLVDGSQAAPHLPLDVHALDADFYAWTAHKAYGPTGIGALHDAPRDPGGDAAVPRRRAHDREGGARVQPLRRAAGAVRGGHLGDRRGGRLRRRRRLPRPLRHGGGMGALPRRRRLCGRPAVLRAGARDPRALAISRAAAA